MFIYCCTGHLSIDPQWFTSTRISADVY